MSTIGIERQLRRDHSRLYQVPLTDPDVFPGIAAWMGLVAFRITYDDGTHDDFHGPLVASQPGHLIEGVW